MSKHTKGPWKVINGDLKNKKIYQVIGPVTAKKELSPEDVALISAAPELLEALVLATKVVSS